MELQVAMAYKESRVEPKKAEEREEMGQVGGEIGLQKADWSCKPGTSSLLGQESQALDPHLTVS